MKPVEKNADKKGVPTFAVFFFQKWIKWRRELNLFRWFDIWKMPNITIMYSVQWWMKTGDRYWRTLIEFLWTKFMNIDLKYICFLLGSAIPHFTNDLNDLLRQKFTGRIISRKSVVDWLPIFDTLNYFSSCYVKSQIYLSYRQFILIIQELSVELTTSCGK